jgi:hypothetical protein
LPKQHQNAVAGAAAGAVSERNRRARLLAPGFSLVRHFCTFGGASLAAIAVGAWEAQRAHVADLWIVPAYLLVANLVEYLIHRLLMHRPLWPRALYRGHTLGHHRAFHHDSMAIDSWREIELVMVPWFTIALFFAALAPVVALVYRTMGSGAAGLLLLAAIVSFVAYEGMHALYHLPVATLERAGLWGSGAFQFLYRLHRHHHRLTRMRWVNFNISLPLSDRLLGTFETEESWQERRDREAAARELDVALGSRIP